MKLRCPRCGVSGILDEAFAGRKITCPKCKTTFLAAKEPEEPAAAAPVVAGPTGGDGTTAAAADPGPAVVLRDGGDTAPAGPDAESDLRQEPPAAPNIGNIPAPPKVTEAEPPPLASEAKMMAGPADQPAATGEAESEPPPVQIGVPAAYGEAAAGFVPPQPGQETVRRSRRFTVGRALNKAWELTYGVKGPIWGAALIVYGASLVLMSIFAVLMLATGMDPEGTVGSLLSIVNSVLSMILTAGLMYMGVRRATGRTVNWKDVFSGFEVAGRIVIASILQMILVVIGFVLFILPGIYLLVGYMLTLPLIVDKKMSPWQAMETSRKAIHKVWWKISGLYFLVGLICAVSAIPFGIGLIWTMPMAVILCGVVYNYLFTVAEK